MTEELGDDDLSAFGEEMEVPIKQVHPSKPVNYSFVASRTSEMEDGPARLATCEEVDTSERETESDDSSEEIRNTFGRKKVESGEHSSLKRLGQKMRENMISIKSRERKISIKSVKVLFFAVYHGPFCKVLQINFRL